MHDKTLLMTLYKKLNDGQMAKDVFYKMLVRALVDEVAGTRTSIWFFSSSLKDILSCESMYDKATNQWSSGLAFKEDDCSAYFEELTQSKQVIAGDAHSDPATSCFNDLEFSPVDPYGILDVLIEVDGESYGMVRGERGGGIGWNTDDLVYFKQVAAMIGLVLKKVG
ncbi:hypothetical protein [Parachitinimonas caeni]|uniref:GAF domain-containing protein n=1 Tax=Parachitinimonas caeni TaxID=3031301 RepID=A0ABT7DXG4_9NEIS|nr:hypothetical protein [Parachitinimonas caeni]MDK2124761.1 hypothetical protein [Parachitinimonas caeni]